MDRRAFLERVGGGVSGVRLVSGMIVGGAGCLQAPGSDSRAASQDAAREPANPAVAPDDLPVPKSELFKSTPKDAIAAITDPAFGDDWSTIAVDMGDGTYRPRLDGDEQVIDGQILQFSIEDEHPVAGGSRWNSTMGRATDGPNKGGTTTTRQ